jgi:hypothetical protein
MKTRVAMILRGAGRRSPGPSTVHERRKPGPGRPPGAWLAGALILLALGCGALPSRAQSCSGKAAGDVCRPAAGACDTAETCTATAANPGQPMYQPTDGVLYTNVAGDDIAGYAFTPNKPITVTSLGGLFNGTRTVYLFDRSTGAVLASTPVTAANAWTYAPIAPVTLTAGAHYSVAAYFPGSGGAYRGSMTSMPSALADATVDGTCYRPSSTVEPCASSGLIQGTDYGMADFKYLPARGLYQPTDGTLYTNMAGDYIVGYAFTPNKTLTATALGGLFNGTRTVYLFKRSTGTLLASASVTAANAWSYTRITPVTLAAGTSYTVAVYTAGSGAAYRTGLSSMPSVAADASIEGTCSRASSTAEPCASSGLVQGNDYGLADVQYTPSGGGLFCPADSLLPAGSVCRPATGACDVAESCTGSSAACPADAFAPAGLSCTGSSPQQLAVSPQDPTHSDVSIAAEQSIALKQAAGGSAASTAAPPASRAAPPWVTYLFFFSHLDFLDRAAIKEEAARNPQAAADWRNHEQLAAGLDARQGALLKQVANECLEALKTKDAEIQKAIKAFHEQYPDGAFLKAQIPPELHALWQQRVAIVDGQVDRLRSLLGDEGFRKLDSYVRANFIPTVVQPEAGAEKGGAQ